MSGRPRVLVLRSSRFLPRALAAVQARWPDADVLVVHQPGTEDETRAELPGARTISLPAGVRLTPGAWHRSTVAPAVRAYEPHAIVIQLPTPVLGPAWRLCALASLLGRGRFWFALPDGSLHHVTPSRIVRRAAGRAARLAANLPLLFAAGALVAAALPAFALSRVRWWWHGGTPSARGF